MSKGSDKPPYPGRKTRPGEDGAVPALPALTPVAVEDALANHRRARKAGTSPIPPLGIGDDPQVSRRREDR